MVKQNITSLYDYLEDNRDFREIKDWFLNTSLAENENFFALYKELNDKMRMVRKNLNDLSECTEELQATIIGCKNLITREKEKAKSLKKYYNKHYYEN